MYTLKITDHYSLLMIFKKKKKHKFSSQRQEQSLAIDGFHKWQW